VEVIRVDPRKPSAAPLVGEPQPLPAHLIADSPRKMDRLRRSIRQAEQSVFYFKLERKYLDFCDFFLSMPLDL
jgi:hypothetical protein